MAAHIVVIPVPDHPIDSSAPKNLKDAQWRITHVLSDQCPCSLDIIDYLVERSTRPSADERVILIDSDPATAAKLQEKGFLVQNVDGESFCQTHQSEGVPFFQLLSPENQMWYSGAYQNTNFNSPYLDLDILSDAQSGISRSPYPVIGCATSQRLQEMLDPLKLKYN